MEVPKKHEEWTSEELTILSEMHPRFTSKKWKRISEELRKRGFQRNEIECRQKWINFLDPGINKDKWQPWELEKLYDLHLEVGTRWCVMQRSLNRTQNKIKNRFYGTIRNYIRHVLGYFDISKTCYNNEISKLPPTFLNDLFSSQNLFEFMQGEPRNAIQQMGFMVDKKIMPERIRQHRTLYTRLQRVIIDAFQRVEASPEAEAEREFPVEDFPDEMPNQEPVPKREQSTQGSYIEIRNMETSQVRGPMWQWGHYPFFPTQFLFWIQ